MKSFRLGKTFFCFTFLFLFFVNFGFANESKAWWNEGWQYRKKITFDMTTSGADITESVVDVPILFRLHSGNFDFTRANTDGDDIRFVAGDDVTVLKHHVERFDSIDEVAFLWVKIPRISGGLQQDFVWMYYGNADASGGQDAMGTYDANTMGVYHLNEFEGFPKDGSALNRHATSFSGGQGMPSAISNGVMLNGISDKIILPNNPPLDLAKGFTFSTWIRIPQGQDDARIFSYAGKSGAVDLSLTGTRACLSINTTDGTVYGTEQCAEIPLNGWQHVAATVELGNRLAVYLNGQEMDSVDFPETLPDDFDELIVGAASDDSGHLLGDIDEIRISNIARSAGRLKVAYAAEGPDGLLCQYGIEEVGGGGGGLPVFYLATVFKNITLDGWVIIGILILLALISWVVILGKAVFLWIAGKENRSFMEAMTGCAGDPVGVKKNGDQYDSSPLYRVYALGCDILGNACDLFGEVAEKRPVVSPMTLKAFKNSLERGYMEETKRLNSQLVLLTMAISGGPFLGLLGTVWGVMNTFAAMAEAGEANIMAIAPGVASALSTTVFGLIVAIPALFGYNFLASRIKSLTQDLVVFIDQFGLQIEETYGGAK